MGLLQQSTEGTKGKKKLWQENTEEKQTKK
jgi:hypothetical protein